MEERTARRIVERLVEDAGAFRTASFSLASDLANLERSREQGSVEATVFYAARILEALSRCALEQARFTVSASLASNLQVLLENNLVRESTGYFAHALRRLGNQARHVYRKLVPEEAELALLFVERWLEWYFVDYPFGPGLSQLTHNGEPLDLRASPELRRVLVEIDADGFDPRSFFAADRREDFTITTRATSVAAVLAEILIDRDELERAGEVLAASLRHAPDDLRLLQLEGLRRSRSRDFDRALAILEPLLARYSGDHELLGILAGVHKRKWLEDGNDTESLERSQELYLLGWNGSRRTNAYLGINAATLALWEGQHAESRRLATEVAQLIETRERTLAERDARARTALGYWDQVTLAEALLLLGRFAEAANRYGAAFDRHARQQGNIEGTRAQADRILEAMHLGTRLAEIEAREPSRGPLPPLVIGVSGDRALADEGAIERRVHDALASIRDGMDPRRSLAVLSALAEGADRLVARVVLRADRSSAVHAVLPLEVEEYERDFASAASRAEFRTLLRDSRSIAHPPQRLPRRRSSARNSARASSEATRRELAHAWARDYVVDHCDVLFAIWDGLPARAAGGTAEVVARAREVGRALVHVATAAPFAVRCERLQELRCERSGAPASSAIERDPASI